MDGLILAFSHFDTGGLQTLMVRMSEWCSTHNIKSIILYQTVDEYMFLVCKEKNIATLCVANQKERVSALKAFMKDVHKAMLITFELPEFLDYESIRTRKLRTYQIVHIIYNVSPGGMIYGKDFKGFIGNIIYSFYRSIVNDILQNHQAIFMDDHTCRTTLDYYKISDVCWKEKIFLLPMFISPSPKHTYRSCEQKNILTVARAAFPYKGYMFGLIDDFGKLVSDGKDIRLHIVSFGKDIDKLKQKIAEQSQEIQDRIQLTEGMSQQDIKEELAKTFAYIGMGTTILEAADVGVPSIITWHSTMDNKSLGFFHENPRWLGRPDDCCNGIDLLKEMLALDENEYDRMCQKTYIVYKNNYNIDRIMPQILNIMPLRSSILKTIHYFIHTVLFCVRGMRRRLLKLD